MEHSIWKNILAYGALGGLIVGVPLFVMTVAQHHEAPGPYGLLLGYSLMLLALSTVFVAIKRHRDLDLGGSIKFWRAFGVGFAISAVVSLFYAAAWETALAVTHMDFAGDYANAVIAQQKARGVDGPTLAALAAEMEEFKRHYAQPWYRLGVTLAEIFPLGLLVSVVSVVSAALLRLRFLPARRAPQDLKT